ncbi:hypothetical protein RclHR1_08440008 [Rhizophagus clarus]|nr:hypothetical protein RclHR1_08440008 [Rhizophagus clarus]
MSSTRSFSLPSNMLNIRSSSLPSILQITRSNSLPSNSLDTNSTTLPTNIPYKRSASLPTHLPSLSSLQSSIITNERSINDDNIIDSLNEKTSRRYATYDLNWNNTDNYTVQDVNSTLSDPIIIPPTSLVQEDPSLSSPPIIISSPIPPILGINNVHDYSDNEKKYPFPGGITVTTVKVVQIDERPPVNHVSRIPVPKNKVFTKNEINNTYNILKRQITIKKQKKSTTNNNNKSAQTIKERRKTKIYNNVEQDDITQFMMINNNINERKFNGVIRRTSSRRRVGVTHKKSYKKRQIQSQERMVYAPTSNPIYTNDPTDMEDDDIQSPSINRFPWLPATTGPPKLLHASLVPLSQFIKKVEATSTADVSSSKPKRKSVESISAPRPKRPSQLFRQNLLEQSVALSFNEMAMKSFAAKSAQSVQNAQNVQNARNIRNAQNTKSTQSVQSTRKSKRKTVESMSIPIPKRPSQLFRENLLEQSVAMSLNEIAMGRNVLASQPTQSARSTQKLDQEHRESISDPEPKRPSQLFRENLLEQSVAMSLDEAIMGKNVFSTRRPSLNTKIPRRRFSRRGSNAKFRKEKAEKNIKEKNKKGKDNNQGEQQIKQETVNPMVISKILDADELKVKVEEQLRRRAVLQSPQPPPRRFTPPTTESRREVIVRRRSKNTRPEKRLVKPEPSRESLQPFPNHLARRNKSLRWH